MSGSEARRRNEFPSAEPQDQMYFSELVQPLAVQQLEIFSIPWQMLISSSERFM